MHFIFETHPVQYHAPVYQALQILRPDSFRVFYATDCTLRGHVDAEFKQSIQWDAPLLEGYFATVLNNVSGTPLTNWRSLTGRGIFSLLRRERPKSILLCQFSYAYSAAVFVSAILLRIPIWIRMETQDDAFHRTPVKSAARSLIYSSLYKFVTGAFYIGKKSRAHLLKHGLLPTQISLLFCGRSGR